MHSPHGKSLPGQQRAGQGNALGLLAVAVAGAGLLFLGYRIGRNHNPDDSAQVVHALTPDRPTAHVPVSSGPAHSGDDRSARVSMLEPVSAAPLLARPGESPAPGPVHTLPGPGQAEERLREAEERIDRMRVLRRGQDPNERLALAREILAEEGSGPLVVHALQALADLDPTSVAAEIARRLDAETTDPRDREMMAMAIGMISLDENALSLGDLAGFYDQGDRTVQLAAAKAMRARGDESLSLRFRDQCTLDLSSDDPQMRAQAIRQLSSGRDAESLSLILPALQDADEQVRLQALRAVAQNGSPAETMDQVRALSNDSSERVRNSVSRILENLELRNQLRTR